MTLKDQLPLVVEQYLRAGPLRDVVDAIQTFGWSAVVFGGGVRDLTLGFTPRDIDIVVDAQSIEKLTSHLIPSLLRRTRFGGFCFDLSGWLLDIWTLSDTWAFRVGQVQPPTFDNLVRTTFLNVESVSVELFPGKDGKQRSVVHPAFLRGLDSRVVEIQLEANPFPALCVVRALLTAARLDFAVGPELKRYVDAHGNGLTTSQVEGIQLDHYGEIKWDSREIVSWISLVSSSAVRNGAPVRLPLSSEKTSKLREAWSKLGSEITKLATTKANSKSMKEGANHTVAPRNTVSQRD